VPLLLNDHTSPLPAAPPDGAVQAFHRRLPGYAPTPLVELPAVVAAACGVGRVLVKAEVARLGLPSFKVLGASWAAYRLLCARLGRVPEWATVDDFADVVAAELGPLRLVAATDGNHGRAVAHMAALWRLKATILVPEGTAAARIDGIAGEGAEVIVVDGTYDDAVARSAAMASDSDLVVSDTSWPGYEDPPRWVIEGYSTIFAELADQLPAVLSGSGAAAGGAHDLGAEGPAVGPDGPGDGGRAAKGGADVDVVFVPVGVGALASAAAVQLRSGRAPEEAPLLVGVEPGTAACVMAAVAAGEIVEVPGPHRSIMAGLNCGLASPVALPTVTAGFGAFVSVGDESCRRAIRTLAAHGLDVGETGAAALAGLATLTDEGHRAALSLAPDATVLLLATEGVTDPVNFEAIVGRPPQT